METLETIKKELVRIINRWGKDGMLDVEDLDLRWCVWDDNDDVCDEDDAVTMQVSCLRVWADGKDVGIEWSDGTADSIERWDYEEDHGGAYTNLVTYIYEEVVDAYVECSVVVMDYSDARIDIIKMPYCEYELIDDMEGWVLEHFKQYRQSEIYIMCHVGEIEIGESDYNETVKS